MATREQLSEEQRLDLMVQFPGYDATINARGEIDLTPRGWSAEQVAAEAERDRQYVAALLIAKRTEALDLLDEAVA